MEEWGADDYKEDDILLLHDSNELLLQMLKNGKRLNLKPPCHPTIYTDLIRPCWDEEPELRPNFSALIQVVKELQEEDL